MNKVRVDSSRPDLPMPQSLDMEQAVLGSCLIDPDAIYQISEVLKPEDLYYEKHRPIFKALRALYKANAPVDFLSVTHVLETRKELDDIGGASYITSLINAVPTAVHVEQYAKTIRGLAVQRRIISASTKIAEMAYDPKGISPAEMIAKSMGIIESIDEGVSLDAGITARQMADNLIVKLTDWFDNPMEIRGIPTGFDVDKYIDGMHKQDLIIVAGDPKVGKTSWATHVALNVAQSGKRVAFFSLEMSEEQIAVKMAANLAAIDTSEIKKGTLTEAQKEKIFEKVELLAGLPIILFEKSDTVAGIRAKIAAMKKTGLPELIVVDYSQLLMDQGDNEPLRLGEIGRGLKAIAKDFGVPVILIHPVSRDASKESRQPTKADLAWSWALVFHCDVLIIAWRDPKTPASELTTNLIVAANRHGPSDQIVPLIFDKITGRWGNPTRRDE